MLYRLLQVALVFLVPASCKNNTNTNKSTSMITTDSSIANTKNKTDSVSGYAPVNGLSMYYELHGNGQPLVLIHGGGSTIQTTFGNILPLLANHYKVIAVELQAHGHTKDRGKPSSFEQDADDVAALLQYLHIDKAHIFGFSNGGSTALQIAIRHPDAVNKLVAFSAVYKRNGMLPGFFEGMEKASLNNMPQPLQDAYLQITGDRQGLQTMHDRDKNRMLQFTDWPEATLMSIQAPTLLISSDKDVIVPEHTLEMAKKIPHASLMILPGIHGAALGEVCTTTPGSKLPALTTGLIIDFLDDLLNLSSNEKKRRLITI